MTPYVPVGGCNVRRRGVIYCVVILFRASQASSSPPNSNKKFIEGELKLEREKEREREKETEIRRERERVRDRGKRR